MKNNIAKKLSNSMTMGEFRELIKDYDDDARLVFVSDYGDNTHTQQILYIRSVQNLQSYEFVEESAYSETGLAVEEYDEDPAQFLTDAERQALQATEAIPHNKLIILRS